MHEAVLRDFFSGQLDAKSLASDLLDERIVDMESPFAVESSHLVKLCDAVISGDLKVENLESIGFCLVASDFFEWDTDTPSGALVAETIFDWSAPEINFRLVDESVRKFRHRLLTGENLFQPEDVSKIS